MVNDDDRDGRLKLKEASAILGLMVIGQILPDSLSIAIETGPDGATHLNVYRRGSKRTKRLVASLRKDTLRLPK